MFRNITDIYIYILLSELLVKSLRRCKFGGYSAIMPCSPVNLQLELEQCKLNMELIFGRNQNTNETGGAVVIHL